MKKPVRPRKILASVAEFLSGPGVAPRTPNPNFAKHWKDCKKKTEANDKKFKEEMRVWKLYKQEQQKRREIVKAIKKEKKTKVLAQKHPRSGIPAGVKMEEIIEERVKMDMEKKKEAEDRVPRMLLEFGRALTSSDMIEK